jgi:hypothetical protein
MSIRSFVLTAFLGAWCAGCGASATARELEPRADLPRIDGRTVLDRPLAESSADVERAFERFKEMRAEEAPACAVRATELATCLRRSWMPWLARRMQAIEEIVLPLHAAAETQAEALLVAILHALSVDDVFRSFERIEISDDVPEDIRAAMLGEIAMTARNFASRATLAFAECANRASSAPDVVREWEAVCRERTAELDEFVQRTPERVRRDPEPRTAEMPPECRGIERVPAPIADPPNDARPRRVAVVLDEDLLEGEARARLLDAIFARVDAHTELPLIPRPELAEAERNHAERRLTRRGPVCGRAPPFELVLQQRNPNLVLASVYTVVIVGEPAERQKQLIVGFRRPGAAEPYGDVPEALAARIRGEPTEAALLDAVARLGEEEGGGLRIMRHAAGGARRSSRRARRREPVARDRRLAARRRGTSSARCVPPGVDRGERAHHARHHARRRIERRRGRAGHAAGGCRCRGGAAVLERRAHERRLAVPAVGSSGAGLRARVHREMTSSLDAASKRCILGAL